jgi:hypothetical protein
MNLSVQIQIILSGRVVNISSEFDLYLYHITCTCRGKIKGALNLPCLLMMQNITSIVLLRVCRSPSNAIVPWPINFGGGTATNITAERTKAVWALDTKRDVDWPLF